MGRKANLYIQGETAQGIAVGVDSSTYMETIWVFRLLSGKYKGETVAVFENGDKFSEWID